MYLDVFRSVPLVSNTKLNNYFFYFMIMDRIYWRTDNRPAQILAPFLPLPAMNIWLPSSGQDYRMQIIIWKTNAICRVIKMLTLLILNCLGQKLKNMRPSPVKVRLRWTVVVEKILERRILTSRKLNLLWVSSQ